MPFDLRCHGPRPAFASASARHSSSRTADRLLEFLAQRHEKAADQVLRDAGEDALPDAGDQASDLARTLVSQPGAVLAIRLDLEARRAVAVAERARAGHLDAAAARRLLVGQRDLAFERAADSSDPELHVDLVGIRSDSGHALAAGNATRQHAWIVQRGP